MTVLPTKRWAVWIVPPTGYGSYVTGGHVPRSSRERDALKWYSRLVLFDRALVVGKRVEQGLK
eukprot:6361327-Pyramimonas_sp.AAC.2